MTQILNGDEIRFVNEGFRGRALRRNKHVVGKRVLGFYEGQKEILVSPHTDSPCDSFWIYNFGFFVARRSAVHLHSVLIDLGTWSLLLKCVLKQVNLGTDDARCAVQSKGVSEEIFPSEAP